MQKQGINHGRLIGGGGGGAGFTNGGVQKQGINHGRLIGGEGWL